MDKLKKGDLVFVMGKVESLADSPKKGVCVEIYDPLAQGHSYVYTGKSRVVKRRYL